MRRRDFLAVSAAGGLPPLARAFQTGRKPAHPNVLILLADDLGWADVGFHKSEFPTPNIDRLAGQGVRFDRFYSFPLCSPTRSALMTGRSPMRLGLGYTVIRPWSDYALPTSEHTIAETFRAAGYQTGITGKWHLGHARKQYMPNARGFDHAYGHVNGAIDYFTHERDGGLDWHRNGKSVREEGYSTDLIAAEAQRFIRDRDRSRPFFLYVPFNAPHGPLQAPKALIDKYAHIGDPRRRTFAAMVDAEDAAIGRLLATLEKEQIDRDTIVLFFSDNGGPIGSGARNTPLRGQKATTWEGGIRVPAALRWTGKVKPGSATDQVMAVWDVFPTLAAAAGVAPQNQAPFDGRNLWPLISSGRTEPRENLFFSVEVERTIYLAAHHREWKLVRVLPEGQPAANHLFRIQDDPTEQNDLASRHPEVVKDLVARVEEWRKLHPANGVRHSGRSPAGWKSPAQWAEAARP